MPTSSKEVHFLIVDDDEIDQMAIQRSLHKNKINNPVTSACDGVEALEILRGQNGRDRLPSPYLILLDLNMPRMDGLTFLEELRRDPALADSIVFVLSTSATEEDIRGAYKHHVAGYLVKNQAGEGFLKAVQMLDSYVLVVRFPAAPA